MKSTAECIVGKTTLWIVKSTLYETIKFGVPARNVGGDWVLLI